MERKREREGEGVLVFFGGRGGGLVVLPLDYLRWKESDDEEGNEKERYTKEREEITHFHTHDKS